MPASRRLQGLLLLRNVFSKRHKEISGMEFLMGFIEDHI